MRLNLIFAAGLAVLAVYMVAALNDRHVIGFAVYPIIVWSFFKLMMPKRKGK